MNRRSKEHKVRKRKVAKVAAHPTEEITARATVCCSEFSHGSCGIQLFMCVCVHLRVQDPGFMQCYKIISLANPGICITRKENLS